MLITPKIKYILNEQLEMDLEVLLSENEDLLSLLEQVKFKQQSIEDLKLEISDIKAILNKTH